jgi:hypothetical protein
MTLVLAFINSNLAIQVSSSNHVMMWVICHMIHYKLYLQWVFHSYFLSGLMKCIITYENIIGLFVYLSSLVKKLNINVYEKVTCDSIIYYNIQ